LFGLILFHNSPINDPVLLFENFKNKMADDIRYRRRQNTNDFTSPFITEDYDECLWRINDIIINMSGNTKLLSDFNLPLPTTPRLRHFFIRNHELNYETNYNRDEQRITSESNIATLNDDQKIAFNGIIEAVDFNVNNEVPYNVFLLMHLEEQEKLSYSIRCWLN